MDQSMVAAFIFGAIVIGIGGQAWVVWLDHTRRVKALDIIKASIEAGREPPAAIYEQLEPNAYVSMGLSKRPWGEAIVFGALGISFWIAHAMNVPGANQKYLVVAAVMTAVSVACFALAIFRPGQRPRDEPR